MLGLVDMEITKKERKELRRQERNDSEQVMAKKRITRRVITWLVVLLILGGGTWAVIKIAGRPTETITITPDKISDTDWLRGDRNSKAVLIEYSDFQCPACGAYHPIIEKLNQDFTNQWAFVYRHFPLITVHKNAAIAAQAAEAAGKQGKFWEMHSLLFENQNGWSASLNPQDIFIAYAQQLSINTDQFKTDMNSREIRNKVSDDYSRARQLGLNSTPTFFLNGKKVQPTSYQEFHDLIQNTLAATPTP